MWARVCTRVLSPRESTRFLRAGRDHHTALSEFPMWPGNRCGWNDLTFSFSAEKYLWFYFLTCSSLSSTRPYVINTFKRAWVERVGDYVHSAVSTGRRVATGFSLWVQVAAWGIESHKFGVYFRVHWHFTTVADTAPDAVGSTHLCWNALWPISLAALFTSSGTASFSASETWYTAWPASSR